VSLFDGILGFLRFFAFLLNVCWMSVLRKIRQDSGTRPTPATALVSLGDRIPHLPGTVFPDDGRDRSLNAPQPAKRDVHIFTTIKTNQALNTDILDHFNSANSIVEFPQ
jgi:hypothetical protein